MLLYLVGTGSETILKEFDAAGVQYKPFQIPLAGPMMNAGETIEIITTVMSDVPWEAIAIVFSGWLSTRPSRKVIITTTDNRIVHAEGLTVSELEGLMRMAKNVTVIETKKPEDTTESF